MKWLDRLEMLIKSVIKFFADIPYKMYLCYLENKISYKTNYGNDYSVMAHGKEIKHVSKKMLYDNNVFFVVDSYFYYPYYAKKYRKKGYIEGINFISGISGEYFRERWGHLGKQHEWRNVEKYRTFVKKFWEDRVLIMSKMIGSDVTSVLDIGCWDGKLKKYIASDIKYYGCDYVKRQEDTIVCNLNNYEFPDIEFECAFVSGNLEYISDVEWYFNQISKANNEIVLSYSALEYNPIISKRKKESWVNHLTIAEIVEEMQKRGFLLTNSKIWGDKTPILKFEKIGD